MLTKHIENNMAFLNRVKIDVIDILYIVGFKCL